MALTNDSGVAPTSIGLIDKGSGNEKQSEAAEGRPTKNRQVSTKGSRPQQSGNGHGSRRCSCLVLINLFGFRQ